MDDRLRADVSRLALSQATGKISGEELIELEGLLRESDEAVDLYVELLMDDSCLRQSGLVLRRVEQGRPELVRAIEQDERRRVEAEQEEARRREEMKRVSYVRGKQEVRKSYRISRVALFSAMGSMAAMIVLLVQLWLMPVGGKVDMPVGELIGCVGSIWSEESSFVDGKLIEVGGYGLQRGFAELEFINGVKLVLQAPVEFYVDSEDEVRLQRGKVYAKVPPAGHGFKVRTASATVVDLGTEFGISVGRGGKTEAYVFKGVVDLRSGQDPYLYTESRQLKKGVKGEVVEGGQIKTAKFDPKKVRFRRELPSEEAFGVAGERFDVVNAMSGGDGFGLTEEVFYIDTINGQVSNSPGSYVGSMGDGQYRELEGIDIVDGVFVPRPDMGAVVVSSTGKEFADCPATGGKQYGRISNGKYVYQTGVTTLRHRIALGGKGLDNKLSPGLFFHPNCGITFDLDQIRQRAGGGELERFSCYYGVPDGVERIIRQTTGAYESKPSVDFYVLIDGVGRFSKKKINAESGKLELNVNIEAKDKHLTIIATDSNRDNMFDWFVISEPVIELQ